MPDVACQYVLTTPAGVLTFNDGSADQFYIQAITGLDGAPIRAPMDPIAYGDGGHSYHFWKGPRLIAVEGVFFVTSLPNCPAIVPVWNEMEEELITIMDSINGDETMTGTLVWRPTGLAQRTLTVRNYVAVECAPDQGFLVRTFTFGLVADDPAWVEST